MTEFAVTIMNELDFAEAGRILCSLCGLLFKSIRRTRKQATATCCLSLSLSFAFSPEFAIYVAT